MAKTDSTPSQKPLLFGNAMFDATALEDIEKFEGESFDWSYVPGYSEQRKINELRVRDGKKPIEMDKLYWPRASRIDGTNVDYREAVTVSRLGYRACTVEDLKERGWGMPPAAHVAADGTIRREDTVLAIVDSDRAAKNLKKQNEINAEFEARSMEDNAPEAGHAGITDVSFKVEKHGRGMTAADAAKALRNS